MQQLTADIIFDDENVDFIPFGEELPYIPGVTLKGIVMGWGASFVCITLNYIKSNNN